MAVKTQRFLFTRDFPVDEINRFFEDNQIDRTQVLVSGVVQLSPNSMAFFVTYEDIINPYVVGTSPPDGASSVVISTPVIIQFSEAIQTPSAADFSFTRNGAPITLGVTVSVVGSVVTITGLVDATYGAAYAITVKTTIKDVNGNPMAQPYVFSFVSQAATSAQLLKAGRVTPNGTDISNGYSTVAFATAMPSDAYRVPDPSFHHISPLPTGLPFGITPFRITDKLAAGFKINFDVPFPSGAAMEWFAIWGAPS